MYGGEEGDEAFMSVLLGVPGNVGGDAPSCTEEGCRAIRCGGRGIDL